MIRVCSPSPKSARAVQLRGMFDIPETDQITHEWLEPDFNTLLAARPWNIGLITGPSGCGKSTIAENAFPSARNVEDLCFNRDPAEPIIDAFPGDIPLRQITELLSSVGFSSPPSWLKPFNVLSTGQQFRANIALALSYAEPTWPVLCDEYTSVVDRTVAQVGSAAVARTVRSNNLKFIAVTCHADVEDWLQPDWIYLPAENRFSWRSLHRRPPIALQIFRCHSSAWPLFAPHHYLTAELNPAAPCFLASIGSTPVAFSAWLPHFGAGPKTRREHRTVCLPDYQGVGIGNTLSATIASMWMALGIRATSTTTHPGMIAARQRSTNWKMHRAPSLARGNEKMKHATTRLTASFTYVGLPMTPLLARALAP